MRSILKTYWVVYSCSIPWRIVVNTWCYTFHSWDKIPSVNGNVLVNVTLLSSAQMHCQEKFLLWCRNWLCNFNTAAVKWAILKLLHKIVKRQLSKVHVDAHMLCICNNVCLLLFLNFSRYMWNLMTLNGKSENGLKFMKILQPSWWSTSWSGRKERTQARLRDQRSNKFSGLHW